MQLKVKILKKICKTVLLDRVQIKLIQYNVIITYLYQTAWEFGFQTGV